MKRIKNILVVDDDLVSSYLISSTLEEMAVADQIATVYDGKQALDFLDENCCQGKEKDFCPFFILLDLNMPVMSGFEFLEEFSHLYASLQSRVAICILSSSDSLKDFERAKQYPIAGFITKPLSEEKLKQVLAKL